MNDNDRRYIDHSVDCVQLWVQDLRAEDWVGPQAIWSSLKAQATLVLAIMGGLPSPWHDEVPEDYVAMVNAWRAEAGL